MIPKGKGMFVWQLKACASDNPNALAFSAKVAGFSWVAIKIQNGISEFQLERLPEAIDELRSNGIKVFGWGYLYGADWIGRSQALREAELTAQLCLKHKLDGFFIDVEKEYKRKNASLWATTYMEYLWRHLDKDISIGLCSYRYPSYHPELPWHNFLDLCDFHAPQVYWAMATNPGDQLKRSVRELTTLENLPVVPLGSAYKEGGWAGPTVAQMDEFDATAKELELPGLSWWSWQHAEANPVWWDTIAAHEWIEEEPEPPTDVVLPPVARVRVTNPSGVYLRTDAGPARTDNEAGIARAGQEFELLGEEGEHYKLAVYAPKASFG